MLKNIICKSLILCVLCCLPLPAFASEADFEKRMARGVAALEVGNAVLAQEEFREALKEHPTDPEASLYLAIALNRAGDPAAEPALKRARRRDQANPRINFELGTFYYNRTMFDEAVDYFENLQAQKPEPGLKAAAEAFLADIRGQIGGKRWGITLTGGMQYDTNVPLANAGTALPPGIDRRSDWREVLNLGITGVAYRDSQQELSAGYSLYRTIHLQLSEFNLTRNLFDISYKRQISPKSLAKVSGGIEYIDLGGNRFVSSYNVTPGLQTAFKEGMTTAMDFRFRNSTFKNSTIFPANTDRNGSSYSALLSHRQRLSELFTMRLGYTLNLDLADVDAWSSLSNTGSAGLAVSLTNRLLFDVSTEASLRKFDKIQTGAPEIRSDATLTGAATLTWQTFEQAGVSVGYHHIANSSNISGYDFTRGITSMLFQGKY